MALKIGRSVRAPLTSFVGRRRELDRLRDLLARTRIVTITGPGGSGKTRLAEELAAGLGRSMRDGTAYAYLGDAGGGDVADIVAGAVGLRARAGEIGSLLAEYLAPRRVLLVIDNCEHVRDAAAALAAQLLAACPGVLIVATSRRPLGVPGEQLFPLEGLPEDAAVALFEDRARLVSPDFALAADTRPVVAELSAHLDGMPLAIELAAAQTRHLGLVELADRMTGHLADLAGGAVVGPERQRSLRRTITWSHDLLTPDQRVAWRRLCIFAGGFTLEAAESVIALPPLERDDVERLLAALVDQSMVAFDGVRGRYRVVEAMREFGLERLREAEGTTIAARHRAWILERAENTDRRWFGPDQAALLDEMNAEAANLRAALDSSRETEAFAEGLRLASASLWYWLTRASLNEAARWFGAFIGRSSDVAIEARAHWRAGYIAVILGDFPRGRALLERGAHFAEVARDPGSAAYARTISALRMIYEQSGEDALPLVRETVADPAADPMCRCWGLIGIAMVSFLKGDHEECRRACLEGIEICRAAGESWTQELNLRFLASALWQLGEPHEAEAALLEALRIDRQLDDVWHFAFTMEVLGWVSVDLGRLERAARLLGIASTFWERTGSGLARPWHVYQDAARERLRVRLGMERTADEFDAGARLDRAAALAFALDEAAPTHPVARRPTMEESTAVAPSPRELEVARLVADGLGNPSIAERLFLSPRTVEKHVEHLMNKLGVDSRAAIAAWHARIVEADRTA